jgi:NAD(P)-dependent dehydrogenase (short-subunit alcohol dehydrogenase family)
VNVTGTFVPVRVAARRMVARGGSIVTVGSVSAVTARMGKVPYCTSKAAVLGLTRSLALELAPLGIRVNAVCPGPTDTDMVREAVAQGGPQVLEARLRGSLEQFRPGIPMGRLGAPDEQAALIEFVLLHGTFMSGTVTFSDGGLTVV